MLCQVLSSVGTADALGLYFLLDFSKIWIYQQHFIVEQSEAGRNDIQITVLLQDEIQPDSSQLRSQ